MQTIKETLALDFCYFDSTKEKILFFDIETTGLSADVSSLYLVGCLFFEHESWHLRQWFADDYKSEEAILRDFFAFLSSFDVLLHYNGSGFDLPYLLKKCRQYNLPFDFSKIESMDLYKALGFLKPLLSFANRKQKTLEKAAGFQRKDLFDGGELIAVYCDYMKNKILARPYEMQLYALLLHNKEDLLGLFCTANLLYYRDFLYGAFDVTEAFIEEHTFHIHLLPEHELVQPFVTEQEDYILKAGKDTAELLIPITEEPLKYFYKDYQNYYYLPQEDTAIHKSIAAYVDKDYRQKAKKGNCYTKKEGRFLPQRQEIFTPALQKDYRLAPYYFELTEEFLYNKDKIKTYAANLLQALR